MMSFLAGWGEGMEQQILFLKLMKSTKLIAIGFGWAVL